MNFIFLMYGAVIVLIDTFAIWKPRAWVEWTERQFIYKRERIGGGSFFVLLGTIPIYWIVGFPAWQFYVLSVLSGLWIAIGVFVLVFPEAVRDVILALGGIEDKWLRWLFVADALVGVGLVVLGVLL